MSELTDRLATLGVDCDPPLQPDELITDAIVVARVLEPDDTSRIEIITSEGTDGITATGLIETASRIGIANWVAQVAEGE